MQAAAPKSTGVLHVDVRKQLTVLQHPKRAIAETDPDHVSGVPWGGRGDRPNQRCSRVEIRRCKREAYRGAHNGALVDAAGRAVRQERRLRDLYIAEMNRRYA